MAPLEPTPAEDRGDLRPSPPSVTTRGGRPLAVFAVAYNLAHHNGLFGTAEAGAGTRLADWIDVLTPFVVLLPLLWFLALQRPNWGAWLAAAIGAIVYVEGHGIHLSANSISNVAATEQTAAPTVDVIHLWDEVVGHYLWYGGLAIVLFACALSVWGRSLHLPVWAAGTGGAVSGFTWATNGLEGGTAIFSLVIASTLAVMAFVGRRGPGLSVALLAGGVVAVGVLAGYGLWHDGFPQPSTR